MQSRIIYSVNMNPGMKFLNNKRHIMRTKATAESISNELTTWVLPMTIVGRAMGIQYENIMKGLLIMGVAKSLLFEAGIIHY